MSASGQRLIEAQIRERLDLVNRWRESGLPMRVWAQGQGLERGTLACQAVGVGCEAQGQGSGLCARHEVGR